MLTDPRPRVRPWLEESVVSVRSRRRHVLRLQNTPPAAGFPRSLHTAGAFAREPGDGSRSSTPPRRTCRAPAAGTPDYGERFPRAPSARTGGAAAPASAAKNRVPRLSHAAVRAVQTPATGHPPSPDRAPAVPPGISSSNAASPDRRDLSARFRYADVCSGDCTLSSDSHARRARTRTLTRPSTCLSHREQPLDQISTEDRWRAPLLLTTQPPRRRIGLLQREQEGVDRTTAAAMTRAAVTCPGLVRDGRANRRQFQPRQREVYPTTSQAFRSRLYYVPMPLPTPPQGRPHVHGTARRRASVTRGPLGVFAVPLRPMPSK